MRMHVVIADHNLKARIALTTLLQEQPGMVVIGAVAESSSLLKLIAKEAVDVLVLDCSLPFIPLSELITQIRMVNQSTKVIAISSDLENARRTLMLGINFFVSKSSQPEWLLDTLARCERN
jgi:DNA-binding NarL/FixJ family response regulator